MFTQEERRRGSYARAEKLREERQRARELVEERLLELAEKAVAALAQALDSADPRVQLCAAIYIVDRILGKPVERTELSDDEGGDLRWRLQALVAQARQERDESA